MLISLIRTQNLPRAVKQKWPEYQRHVSKLLFQWMELQRNQDFYEPFSVKSCSPRVEHIQNLDHCEACVQNYGRSDAEPLPLTKLPPSTRIAVNQWGATLQDYSYLFSFSTNHSKYG